jgi:hypothetical protein
VLTLTDSAIAPESPKGKDLSASYDLDRALVEAAKEINVDWPEFLPVERIKVAIAKTALGLLLLAGILALGPEAPNSAPQFYGVAR